MPKKAARSFQIMIFPCSKQWIAQGAKTARPEPEQVPKYWITEEEREFWAFQEPMHRQPPVRRR